MLPKKSIDDCTFVQYHMCRLYLETDISDQSITCSGAVVTDGSGKMTGWES
jgi:hypothetical protein